MSGLCHLPLHFLTLFTWESYTSSVGLFQWSSQAPFICIYAFCFFFFHFFYAILPVKPTLPPAPRKSLYSLLNPLKTFPKKFPIHGTPGAPVPWFHNFYLNLAVTSPANTSKDCLLTMAFENVKHLRLCSLNTDIHLRHAIWKIITWFSRSN